MRYHLLIDADDTLWENNIYFEHATHAFIEFLNHSRLSPEEVRAVLYEIEKLMGYGSVSFTSSLLETYHRLAEKDVREEDMRQMEHEEVAAAGEGQLLTLARFTDLRNYF